jgi:hypothetical protein
VTLDSKGLQLSAGTVFVRGAEEVYLYFVLLLLLTKGSFFGRGVKGGSKVVHEVGCVRGNWHFDICISQSGIMGKGTLSF